MICESRQMALDAVHPLTFLSEMRRVSQAEHHQNAKNPASPPVGFLQSAEVEAPPLSALSGHSDEPIFLIGG